MLRLLSSATALALAVTGVLVTSPTTAQVPEAARTTPTRFVLGGLGYGSTVQGGDLPAESDTTAYESLGCTNRAGLEKSNHLTRANLPGAGSAHELTTNLQTAISNKGVVASRSQHDIQRVVLGSAMTGQLVIRGLVSRSRAFHDGDRFGATTFTSIGTLTYLDPAGTEHSVEEPTPGVPVTVPGIATLAVGKASKVVREGHAFAAVTALFVTLEPSGTRIRLGRSQARIEPGVKSGIFGGHSAAVRSSALDGNVSIGRQPLSLVPCLGTDGVVLQKHIAKIGSDDGVVLQGLSSRQQSDATMERAGAYTRGRVAEAIFGDGELLVRNVIGRALAVRSGEGLIRSIKGTTSGDITYQGDPQEFPEGEDVLEIPGVARLQRSIVTKLENGIEVTALRVTLFDDSGGVESVFELGEAETLIRDSGR